jgi:hypothetical protein
MGDGFGRKDVQVATDILQQLVTQYGDKLTVPVTRALVSHLQWLLEDMR